MLCSLVRWQLDGALDGSPLGRIAAAHLARCEGCQARAARLDALHGSLAAGARAAVPPRPTEMPVARPGGRRAAFALAAVGAVAAIAFIARPGEQPPRAPAAAAAAEGIAPDRVADRDSEPDGRGEAPDPAIDPAIDAPGGAPTSARRGALVARLGGVLFRAPRPLRAELAALAADGKRGALTILHIGGVGSWSDRTP
jgi:hypothetical protein